MTAIKKIREQRKAVEHALKVVKQHSRRADKEAMKLSRLIDNFPGKDRDLFAEELGRAIEFLELKFVFINNKIA